MEIGLQRLMREQGSGRETTMLDINSFSDSFAGKGSPTLRRACKLLEGVKRNPDRCSRCKILGHKKNSKECPLYNQIGGDIVDDQDEPRDESDENSGGEIVTDQGEDSHDEDEASEDELDDTDKDKDCDIEIQTDSEHDSDDFDDECETQ